MSLSSEVLARSPLGYWKFDEHPAYALDATGGLPWPYGAGVTVGGSPLVSDGGTSVHGSGSARIASLPSVATGMTGQNVTLEAWVTIPAGNVNGPIIHLGTDANGWAMGVGGTTFDNTGKQLILLTNGIAWNATGYTFTTGTHHVMVVRGTGNSVTCYVDGSSVATLSLSSPGAANGIMAVGGSQSRALSSTVQVDNVALFASALSSTRVTAHYNSGAGSNSAVLADSPVAFLKFDETSATGDSGTTAADSSGNSRTLTNSSSPLFGLPSILGSGAGYSIKYVASANHFSTIAHASWMNTPYAAGFVRARLEASTLSGDQYIASRWVSGANLAFLWYFSGGKAKISIYAGGAQRDCTGATTLTAGTDVSVGWSYDGTTLKIFVNGVLDGSTSYTGTLGNVTASYDVARAAAAVYGNVTLDELAHFGAALSDSDHATLHAAAIASADDRTGTVAGTLPALTASASGTTAAPTFTGAVSATLPALTASAAGTHTSNDRTGVTAATLPALTAAITGTHTSNDQVGTVSATLPALTGSVAGTFTAPATTGVVAPTLPPLTGAVDGSILNPVTGTVGATLPHLTAVIEAGSNRTGTVAGTLPALSAIITGTTGDPAPPVDDEASPVDDEVDDDDPTLALPPEGYVERPIMRRSVTVPDLSAYPKDPVTGQPHVTDAEYAEWEADAVVEEVGVVHVTFPNIDDPNDVTYYRGLPLQGLRFLRREPFGDADADVTIPGITSMDTHPDDAGAPHSFTRARANCEFWVYKSTGEKRRLWSGNVFTRTLGNDGRQPTMNLHALGSLYMADSTRNRPIISDSPLDYGYEIPRAFNLVTSRRYKNIAPVTTGILTKERGAWSDSPMGFALDGLAKCWTIGGNQWTIAKVVGSRRQYEMRLKKTEPEWTFTNGARGVYVDIEEDDNGRNVIFGHGVNSDGGIWFNTKYPDDGRVYRLPLAADPATQKWLYDDAGNVTGPNPAYNVNVMPREDDVDFGQNSRAIGIRSAQQIVDRESVPSFVGRITVETDPREGWRGDIQAGDKLTLIGYQGRDLVLHVSDVEVSFDGSMPVTLTVDERSRDAMTVAQIRDRNKEARRDPALRPGNPNRRSRLEQDQIVPFDSESPAGRIPASFAAGGQWTVISVPFATAGRIAKVHFDTGSPMAAGLFAIRPTVSQLNSLIGNPLTQDDPLKAHMNTLENDYGLCAFWGQKGQRMGYSPGREDASDPFTGDFDEATGFDYVAQANARLYLAVYPAASTTVSGRCYPALVV